MSKLMDKIRKNSTIKLTDVLSKSEFMNDVDETVTDIPMINVALSGKLDGGLKSGILTIAGPSRHFKTMYALYMASAYLRKNKEAVLLLYDSEFGSPLEYFRAVGIDTDRVIHTPVKNLEELKFDLMQQLEGVEKGDKLFILIDSIGNLASKKEAEDAIDGKSVADMSRAKFLKGLYRIITPYLRIKDIPLVQIGHIYMTQEMFSKPILSGGTGIMLASDNVWLIGRSQDKDSDGLNGYNFTINIEKSRYVREKSKIPINVQFEGGMSKYSGLLDIAMELKFVIKPSNGWYSRVDEDGVVEEKKWRAKDTDTADFWDLLLKNKNFQSAIENRFMVSSGELMDSTIDKELGDIDDEV
jgi:hypothetical protein